MTHPIPAYLDFIPSALLGKALDTLLPEDREIIEGNSGSETANILELGLEAMKTRLHRARLKLMAED